ncbi:MAG: hypothetical protein ACLTSX_13135 [Collinsella sp.]
MGLTVHHRAAGLHHRRRRHAPHSLTGITLPFISQGGSSLIASFIIVGCLLRCGDEGTGVDSEMRQTWAIGAHGSDAVLGRVALGKRLTGTMIVFSVLFAVLVANLTYLMVIIGAGIPEHAVEQPHHRERGPAWSGAPISTADGTVLATSVRQEDGSYKREYPAGELAAHIVGYTSERFGTAGIEAAYNDTLRGEQNFASFTDVVNSLAGIQTKGNDVVLSIDSRIQQAAQDALAGQVERRGGPEPRDRRRVRSGLLPHLRRRQLRGAAHRRRGRRQRFTPSCSTAPPRHCTRPAPPSRW